MLPKNCTYISTASNTLPEEKVQTLNYQISNIKLLTNYQIIDKSAQVKLLREVFMKELY